MSSVYSACDVCERQFHISNLVDWKCLACSTPEDDKKVLKSIEEFKKIAYCGRECIYSRKQFIEKNNWCPTSRTVIVICCDYSYEGVGNINYGGLSGGNRRFNKWIEKYDYGFDWYDAGLVTIYKK
jgi:hypothetical protein